MGLLLLGLALVGLGAWGVARFRRTPGPQLNNPSPHEWCRTLPPGGLTSDFSGLTYSLFGLALGVVFLGAGLIDVA